MQTSLIALKARRKYPHPSDISTVLKQCYQNVHVKRYHVTTFLLFMIQMQRDDSYQGFFSDILPQENLLHVLYPFAHPNTLTHAKFI